MNSFQTIIRGWTIKVFKYGTLNMVTVHRSTLRGPETVLCMDCKSFVHGIKLAAQAIA